jgi:hypothetical protein
MYISFTIENIRFDMFLCSGCDEWLLMSSALGWVSCTYQGVRLCVANMSFGLWCAGKVRRRWSTTKVNVTWVRANGSSVAKNERWVLIERVDKLRESCCRRGCRSTGHVSRSPRRGGHVWSTLREGFSGWASNSPSATVSMGIGGETWFHRKECIEAKQLRKEWVVVRSKIQELVHFAPDWVARLYLSMSSLGK